jgi:biopolymer transport protein ExbD
MRVLKPKRPADMQPPMTPMIDCTFNLLIFFLLTPSFSLVEGYLTTNLPMSGQHRMEVGPPPLPLKVELIDQGDRGEGVEIILPGGRSLGADFAALRTALKDMQQRGLAADTPVLLSPTTRCRHKWVVEAFDSVVAARFMDIRFAVPKA